MKLNKRNLTLELSPEEWTNFVKSFVYDWMGGKHRDMLGGEFLSQYFLVPLEEIEKLKCIKRKNY